MGNRDLPIYRKGIDRREGSSAFLTYQSCTKFLLRVSAKGIRKYCRFLDISVKLCGGINVSGGFDGTGSLS